MTGRWCPTCGDGYGGRRWGIGDAHNCGTVTIAKDRLRELEAAERQLTETQAMKPAGLSAAPPNRLSHE